MQRNKKRRLRHQRRTLAHARHSERVLSGSWRVPVSRRLAEAMAASIRERLSLRTLFGFACVTRAQDEFVHAVLEAHANAPITKT